ncbi:hypothetical protein ACFYYM_35885 [Streptomyces erythrochromogenes]|uniref:hypothetical protein n=1 Tax=Streptomyces erythrochromogenes TaxID=285574 RepID=UPI0036CD14B3
MTRAAISAGGRVAAACTRMSISEACASHAPVPGPRAGGTRVEDGAAEGGGAGPGSGMAPGGGVVGAGSCRAAAVLAAEASSARARSWSARRSACSSGSGLTSQSRAMPCTMARLGGRVGWLRASESALLDQDR